MVALSARFWRASYRLLTLQLTVFMLVLAVISQSVTEREI
jgi:hypothetical protein